MRFAVVIGIFIQSLYSAAQGNWNPKANLGGGARGAAFGFSIGLKGYIGGGYNSVYLIDFWEWDQLTNVWTQKANFIGTPRTGAVSFVIGSKGYVTTGSSGFYNYRKDLWEWDASTNIWILKANVPTVERTDAAGFSIGQFGYVCGGYDMGAQHRQDLWEWNQSTNAWTQKANFPAIGRKYAFGFSIGQKGYIGAGYNGGLKQDFWEWDQPGNTWTQRANYPFPTQSCACFTMGTKGYVGTGSGYPLTKSLYEWDQATDTWTRLTDFGGIARGSAVGFTIAGRGYIGTGSAATTMMNDLWEWDPACNLNLSVHHDTTITCGASISLNALVANAGGNVTYIWSPATGLNNTTIANPAASPLVETIYQVVAQDQSNSCVGTAQVRIKLTQPACTITSPYTLNCGSSTTITANYANPAHAVYNWAPAAGLNNTTSQSPLASPLAPTEYTVTVTDTVTTCVSTAKHYLNVYPISFDLSGQQFVCSPSQVTTLCADTMVSYSWSNGQTTSCIQVSPALTTAYSVTVTNTIGCQGWKTTTVTVGSVGPGGLLQTHNQSACGLNYVNASVLTETRSAQGSYTCNVNGTGLPTTLSVAGIPAGATILRSYIWYTSSYKSFSVPVSSVSVTNSVPATYTFAATLIGMGVDKCWNETGTANYRADVTSSISGNGVYGIDITGFTDPDWEVDGVDLMVIYRENGANYYGTLVIYDGNVTPLNGAGACKAISGLNVCAIDSNARAFSLISDQQENQGFGVHATTLNGSSYIFPNDFWNWDEAQTIVSLGQTNASFSSFGEYVDCYDWAVMGLYFKSTTCVNCATSVPDPVYKGAGVSISPNPSSGLFTIQSSEKISSIEIMNVLGEKLHFVLNNVSLTSCTVDLRDQPKGVYFYKVFSENDSVSTGKVIIE